MDNSEENRRIAEWATPKPASPAWKINTMSLQWEPADFCRSEEASALLLEKMPNPVLVRLFDGNWSCDADQASPLDVEYRATDHDRKTAIVLAALKLIEQEKSC